PHCAPKRFVDSEDYRPSLRGLVNTDVKEEYALVECETKPRTTRLLTKNIWRVELQSKIDRQPRLRRILVVPRGKLGALDPKLRHFCEIWVADKADILKITICPPPRKSRKA